MALQDNAAIALERLVGVEPGESVLLLTDPSADSGVRDGFAAAIRAARAEPVALAVPTVLEMGEELPDAIDDALSRADVAVIVSRWLPSWVATKGMWRALNEYGTRVLHVDPPHLAVLGQRIETHHLESITRSGRALRAALDGAKQVLLIDRHGNELRCGIDAANCHVSEEFPVEFGFTKLPSGVFTVSVEPGTYEGRFVWDAVEGCPRAPGDRIEVAVEAGVVVGVDGHGEGMEYVRRQVAVSEEFARVTELGIGTNPGVRATDLLGHRWHEAANRAAGIVHFGLGSSHTAEGPGGRLPFHTHLVSLDTSAYALPDRTPLLDRGRIVVYAH